ncbi:hypothetical protein DFH28DRAFT_1108743 [Melampsora americana]|nr:hypothetical protein DFH28DRAFT_1108743 [Melampsora americana]
MTNEQPLPEWLKLVTLTYQNSDQVTTGLVQLPITYSGPSIPLGWPYTSIPEIQTQTEPLASIGPLPTQVVHFYDGSGPFTVIGGTIITDFNLIPKPTGIPNQNNQNQPLSTITDLRRPINSASVYPVIISTVTITAPSPITPNTTNPLIPSDNPSSSNNQATALIAGFIILLILLVFIVLALLIFLLRRRRREYDGSPHHSTGPIRYEFNSALLPQHHHGSQTHPHVQLDHLDEGNEWMNLNESKSKEEISKELREKSTPKPHHHHHQELINGFESQERKLNAWKRFQKVIRQEFNNVLQSFSMDSNERPNTSPRGAIQHPSHEENVYHNPYHDPSISTNTFVRVKRWWNSVITPPDSLMSVPHTFKTISESDSSNDEIHITYQEDQEHQEHQHQHSSNERIEEVPFIFNKSSTLSPSINTPLPLSETYSNTPKRTLPNFDPLKLIKKSKQSVNPSRSKPSSKQSKSKSIKSRTSSHQKPDVDHPPLLNRSHEEAHGLSEEEVDDGHSIGPDSPLEHFHPYGLPSHSPSHTKQSSNHTATSGTPKIDLYAKRIRPKKDSLLKLSPPKLTSPIQSESSPRSISYQSGLTPTHSSPGKILILKKQNRRSSAISDRLRFPLPPAMINHEENFVDVLPTAGIESTSSASRTTEDEEILFTGRRKSSISHLAGVSELGVVEPSGQRWTQDGSYVSEDLFYVRPRLATFKDGRWITKTPTEEGQKHHQIENGSAGDLDIMITPKGNNNNRETMKSTTEFPSLNENRRTVNRCVSSDWIESGIGSEEIKSSFRDSGHRTVSLPMNRSSLMNEEEKINLLNRKLSPLDQLKQNTKKESQNFREREEEAKRNSKSTVSTDDRSHYDDDEEEEEDEENSEENSFDDDDESSRLLSRQSHHSRTTLGQRLVIGEEITSLKGSLQKIQKTKSNERFKDLENETSKRSESKEIGFKEEESLKNKGKEKVIEVEVEDEGSDLSSVSLYATPLCRSQHKKSSD